MRLLGDPSRMEALRASYGKPLAMFSELRHFADRTGARFDNSPTAALQCTLGDRVPVLVTTNGTRTVEQLVPLVDEVVLAAFVNLRAVAEYLQRRRPSHVTIVPAGRWDTGDRRTEDDACAETLLMRLTHDRRPDYASVVDRVRSCERVQRRVRNEPGLKDDVDYALTVDAIADVVGRVESDDHGLQVCRTREGTDAPVTAAPETQLTARD
jgi:phosphosulfolactate phosphohydrolase-like enzyme